MGIKGFFVFEFYWVGFLDLRVKGLEISNRDGVIYFFVEVI